MFSKQRAISLSPKKAIRSSNLLAHVGDNSDEKQKGSTRTLQDTLKRKGSDLDNDDNSPKRKVLKETEQEPTHSSASNSSSSNRDEVDEVSVVPLTSIAVPVLRFFSHQKVKAGDSVDGTHTAVAQAKVSPYE